MTITTPRRFPPPWSIEDIGACFLVKDASGQKLAAVYYEEKPGQVHRQLSGGRAQRKSREVQGLPGEFLSLANASSW
jgi:hypothetical protein